MTDAPTATGADRAVVPAVSKVLEIGLVVLYVALMTTALFGGTVPEYRTAAAAEVADRTLVDAADTVEGAVPPAVTAVSVRAPLALPDTIRGAAYRVRTDGEALVLDHPDPAVGGRVALSLPGSVNDVRGSVESGESAVVVVEGTDGAVLVRLTERGR